MGNSEVQNNVSGAGRQPQQDSAAGRVLKEVSDVLSKPLNTKINDMKEAIVTNNKALGKCNVETVV